MPRIYEWREPVRKIRSFAVFAFQIRNYGNLLWEDTKTRNSPPTSSDSPTFSPFISNHAWACNLPEILAAPILNCDEIPRRASIHLNASDWTRQVIGKKCRRAAQPTKR